MMADSAVSGRLLRIVVVLACAALAAWLFSIDLAAQDAPRVVAPRGNPDASLGGRREITFTPTNGPAVDAPIPERTPLRRTVEVARPVTPLTPPPPELPYRFLGKVTVEGDTALVLYGRGRTVKVRAPGQLDDDWVVDAIEDGYLMLRHVPLGASHILELVSQKHAVVQAGLPAETPQD